MDYDPSISIDVSDDVYPPSDDSILLIRSLDVKKGDDILEIGCGSGIVSIHCAKNGCNVTCVDVNRSAVKCTKKNAEKNNVRLNVFFSDLYQNVNGRFDIIVFNLPYLPVDEPGVLAKAWSGGKDGLGPLPKLLSESKNHLKENGRIVIVTSSLMDQNKLDSMLSKYEVKKKGTLPLFFEKLDVLEIIP